MHCLSCLLVFALKNALFVVAGSHRRKQRSIWSLDRAALWWSWILLPGSATEIACTTCLTKCWCTLLYTSSKKTWTSTREVWVLQNPHTLCRPEYNCKDLKWHLFWPGPLEWSQVFAVRNSACTIHIHRQYHCWLPCPEAWRESNISLACNSGKHLRASTLSMLTWSFQKKDAGGIGCLHRSTGFFGTKTDIKTISWS